MSSVVLLAFKMKHTDEHGKLKVCCCRYEELHSLCEALGLPKIKLAYDTTGTRMAGKCRLLTSMVCLAKAVLAFHDKQSTQPFTMSQSTVDVVVEMEGLFQLGAINVVLAQYETLFNGAMPSLMKDSIHQTLQ